MTTSGDDAVTGPPLPAGYGARGTFPSASLRNLAAGALAFCWACSPPTPEGAVRDEAWTDAFLLEGEELVSTGRNPYFILEPGYVLHLTAGFRELVVTVLDETRRVGDVETRVVEERELEGGELVEVSRNFFAIGRRTNSVYYFGEEVDLYEGGEVVRHEGEWEAGVEGARFGLMMPGLPLQGARYYQEIAPEVAMDRAEILSVEESLVVPAGTFQRVLLVEETTPLEPGAREYKYFAPGVGLLQDEDLRLLSFGFREGGS